MLRSNDAIVSTPVVSALATRYASAKSIRSTSSSTSFEVQDEDEADEEPAPAGRANLEALARPAATGRCATSSR